MIRKNLTKQDIADKINLILGFSKEEAKSFIESFFSIIEDKVDPAKSAIVPPITLSGEGTLTGELPSNKHLEDTRRESKRQISISKNQNRLRYYFN